MRRWDGVGLALTLLTAPLWTGCYATVSSKRTSHEEITGRTQVAQPDQVELAARRDGAGQVEVEATQRRLCRLELTGVDRPTQVTVSRKDSVGYLFGGLVTLFGGAFIAGGAGKVDKASGYYTEEKRASERAAGERYMRIGYGVAGGGLAMLLTYFLLPSQRVVTTDLPEAPFRRWDGPATTCEGTRPVPLQVPLLASTTFAGSPASLEVRTGTGADGRLRLAEAPLARAGGWCGAPTLKIGVAPAVALPGGAVAGPPAGLALEAAPRQPIGELRALDPAAADTALACCAAALGPQVREDCEERCARAAGVPKCLFGRRACLMKAARAEADPGRSAALCENLYAECVVAGGAARRNLDACTEACFTKQAAEACR